LAARKVVVCATPLKLTDEEAVNPDPLIVRVWAAEPTVRVEGEMLAMVGVGFGLGGLEYEPPLW
jgi:hypothetical protein